MTRLGTLDVLGFKFHYEYRFGNYSVFDCPFPFNGWEPSLEEFEAKAIARITQQIAQEPYIIETENKPIYH